MSKSPKIAVIGAGIGGLAAAAILARRFDVAVFERASGPGGKVRQVEIDGRSIDSGPTVFTMDWAVEEVFDRAGAALDEHVRLTRLDLLARHAWADGSRLDLFADRHASAEAIAALAGRREAQNYLAFCERARGVFETLREPFLRAQKPSFAGLVASASPFALLATSPFSTLWSALAQSFDDPRLAQLFGRYATYCGASPFQAPATLMLIAHVEQDGVWALDGGMQALATSLEDVARSNGVALNYDQHVADILSQGGRVTGLKLASGETHAADIVVFNGDASALASGLLGAAPARAAGIGRTPERSQSAMTWSLLGRPKGLDLAMHTVCFSDDYAAEFDAVFRRRAVPDEPTVYLCAPDRAPGIAAKGDERLFCLINAPPIGDEHMYTAREIETCRQRMQAQLARCGLELEIHGDPVATTPSDFARMFPGTGGALYGMASHGWQATFQRPGARTRLKGLYLAGGSVHPGPGVPMAALSGKAAAEAVLRDCGSTLP